MRVAASNWEKEYSNTMVRNGFKEGKANANKAVGILAVLDILSKDAKGYAPPASSDDAASHAQAVAELAASALAVQHAVIGRKLGLSIELSSALGSACERASKAAQATGAKPTK